LKKSETLKVDLNNPNKQDDWEKLLNDNTKKVFVRIVLTHKQYDKGDWK
jgi:hypothetical protein